MDILCFSHLRWQFVYQRPQQLLSRAARTGRVFYVEEPVFDTQEDALFVERAAEQICVLTPHLPPGLDEQEIEARAGRMTEHLLNSMHVQPDVLWFYTPMALGLAARFSAPVVVYDCMDELSLFQGAPADIREREQELLDAATVVFTGGRSLYASKAPLHSNTYCFPSSVDAEHFGLARAVTHSPADQAAIPGPRAGFFGVIDERLDRDLVAAVADLLPEYQFVFVGPVVKIRAEDLPVRPNVHYLGPKQYSELPLYVGRWDVALMPFALNDSTRFISPTKTPEYLAAGLPVVSTPIADVAAEYGATDVVHIARAAPEFAAAILDAGAADRGDVRRQADRILAGRSWDATWGEMESILSEAHSATKSAAPQPGRRPSRSVVAA